MKVNEMIDKQLEKNKDVDVSIKQEHIQSSLLRLLIKIYSHRLEHLIKEKRLMLDKVTPKYDLSWYVKWCSSLLVLTGMLLTSR